MPISHQTISHIYVALYWWSITYFTSVFHLSDADIHSSDCDAQMKASLLFTVLIALEMYPGKFLTCFLAFNPPGHFHFPPTVKQNRQVLYSLSQPCSLSLSLLFGTELLSGATVLLWQYIIVCYICSNMSSNIDIMFLINSDFGHRIFDIDIWYLLFLDLIYINKTNDTSL